MDCFLHAFAIPFMTVRDATHLTSLRAVRFLMGGDGRTEMRMLDDDDDDD